MIARQFILSGNSGPAAKEAMLRADLQRSEIRAALIAGPATFEAASAYLYRHCNSYDRLSELIAFEASMDQKEWWKLLGIMWTGFDSVATHLEALRVRLIGADSAQLAAMMTPYERRRLRTAFGTRMPVFRGCYACNRNGLSWTLSRTIAMQFPYTDKYYEEDDIALLLVGYVDPSRVVLKTDSKEQEVICAEVDVFAVNEL